MVLKNVFLAVVSAALLASGGPSAADEYRAGEFLGLDLSRAVLSPKPLGPTAEFAPVPVEAQADRGSVGVRAQKDEGARAQMEPKAEPKAEPKMAVRKVHVAHVRKLHVAHVRAAKPRAAVPTRMARRHGNPLDAQASISRVQVWPCRSGGICHWKR
jgi:hypothetical protein